jgi:hypothetical protein
VSPAAGLLAMVHRSMYDASSRVASDPRAPPIVA